MTHVATTFDNIRKGAFKNVRTILLNSVVDIADRVYAAYPLKNIQFPLMVINNGAKVPDLLTLTEVQTNQITLIIYIYSKQSETLDSYADTVDKTIRDNEALLETYGLRLIRGELQDNGDVDFVDVNGNRAHVRAISVTFEV